MEDNQDKDQNQSNQDNDKEQDKKSLAVKKKLHVFADPDFYKLVNDLPIKPYEATSHKEWLIVVDYEGTEQEIAELFSKLKTEPFKSLIYSVLDHTTAVIYDYRYADPLKPRTSNFGAHGLVVKRQRIRVLREQSERIHREHAIINPTLAHGEDVLNWSSSLTAESRYNENRYMELEEEQYKDYYLTEAGQRLHFKLTRMPSGEIVGLVGLQGVGKTSLLKKMAYDLKAEGASVFFIHWTPDWFEKLKKNPGIKQAYKDLIMEALSDKVESYARTNRRMAVLGGKIPNRDDMTQINHSGKSLETMEEALTKSECKKAMEAAMDAELPFVRYLFIDLPDYDKQGTSTRNLDLQSIETIWKRALDTAGSEMNATIVLGIQKETYGGHFFYGKMHIVDLKPMTREEMIQAYKHKWKTTEPFTEEALGLIADLSRGIFRRFLRYIAMTVETACERKVFPITIDAVNASITIQKIAEDMSTELAKMFKGDEEQKLLAVKMLTFIRTNPGHNRKEIAEAMEVSEDVSGTILKKFELYSYIRSEHGERKELKWFLV